MAQDIAELSMRKEAMEVRLMEDAERADDEPLPRELLNLHVALDKRRARLVELVGADAAALVCSALEDPANREALGVEVATEDMVRDATGDEAAARVFRRRLGARTVQPLRGAAGENSAATHDLATATGARSLHNVLNTADPEESLSYYQKQQLRYGRARRGSTSVAGAWEAVLGDAVDGSGGGGGAHAPGDSATVVSAAPLQRHWSSRGLTAGGAEAGTRSGAASVAGGARGRGMAPTASVRGLSAARSHHSVSPRVDPSGFSEEAADHGRWTSTAGLPRAAPGGTAASTPPLSRGGLEAAIGAAQASGDTAALAAMTRQLMSLLALA